MASAGNDAHANVGLSLNDSSGKTVLGIKLDPYERSCRIVLLKNGSAFGEQSGVSSKEFLVSEKGIYRIEVYLPQLPQPLSRQPWIISNPIYVR